MNSTHLINQSLNLSIISQPLSLSALFPSILLLIILALYYPLLILMPLLLLLLYAIILHHICSLRTYFLSFNTRRGYHLIW
jgi:hypothetical protein